MAHLKCHYLSDLFLNNMHQSTSYSEENMGKIILKLYDWMDLPAFEIRVKNEVVHQTTGRIFRLSVSQFFCQKTTCLVKNRIICALMIYINTKIKKNSSPNLLWNFWESKIKLAS